MSSAVENRTTQFDLLRHGACEGGQIYRGRSDVPLSPSGWQQMESGALDDPGWNRVISSPLSRCVAFAQTLADQNGLPLDVCDDLKELDFGIWDGQPTARIWEREPERVMAFWRDPVTNPPPDGEDLREFQQRVLKQMADLEIRYAGEKLLVVTHGGVIRVLLCELLQMPLQALQQMSIDYGSLSRIQRYRDCDDKVYSQLIFHNRLRTIEAYG